MRIAILSSGCLPVLDGVTVSVHARVTRLCARGHDVLLMAPRQHPGSAAVEDAPGATFVGLSSRPFGAAAGDRNPVFAANDEIARALAAFGPDIIHVDEPERLAFGLRRVPGRAYARANGVPLLAFYHTHFIDYAVNHGPIPAPLLRPLERFGWRAMARLYGCYDATLVPSPSSHARLKGFGLSNGVCGPFNGADTAAFTPALRRPGYWAQEWSLPELDRRFVLLVAGRLTADKGWRFWEDALPALGRRLGDRLAVVAAGDGALRPQLERLLARALPCGRLLGAVPHGRMPALVANADACATLSRHENASLAVLEALASGTPVIAPRAGGIPDQIRDGRDGLLFAPGDLSGFVQAVAGMVEDGNLAARLRGGAVERRPQLGWDRAFEAWLAAVTTAAERRVAAAPRRVPCVSA